MCYNSVRFYEYKQPLNSILIGYRNTARIIHGQLFDADGWVEHFFFNNCH